MHSFNIKLELNFEFFFIRMQKYIIINIKNK